MTFCSCSIARSLSYRQGVLRRLELGVALILVAQLSLSAQHTAVPTPAVIATQSPSSAISSKETRAADNTETATSRYRLQADDEIAIRVFRNPEFDDTAKIGPDGRLSILMFDSVPVAGMTLDDLRRALTETYSKYIRDPQVSVSVKIYANQKVFVGGEVERPGLLPMMGRMTVLGAVFQSGGFRNTAKARKVYLVRKGASDQPVTIVLDSEKMLKGLKPDVPLQSFDVVYVPKSAIAHLDKFVDQYIRQLIPANLNAGFTYLMSPGSSVIRFQ